MTDPNLPARFREDEPDISDRSRGVALGLAALLGVFGAHRFYVGKTGTGLVMLFTLGGGGLWYLYDLIIVAAGEFEDADGGRLINWEPSHVKRRGAAGDDPRLDTMVDEMDQMRAQLT